MSSQTYTTRVQEDMYILYKLYIVYIMYIVYTRNMSKLDILNDYYRMNRRVGHSYLGMSGLGLMNRPFIYLTEDRRIRAEVAAHNPHALVYGMSYLSKENLWGKQYPIIVDHFTLQLLIDEHNKEVQAKLADLRDELFVKKPDPKWGKNRSAGFEEGIAYALAKLKNVRDII